MIDQFYRTLLNDPTSHKIDIISLLLPVNATLIAATIALVFVIYQLDKYVRFKSFSYVLLSVYLLVVSALGIALGLALLQISSRLYSVTESNLYLLYLASPFIVITVSALYVLLFKRSIDTERLVQHYMEIQPTSKKGLHPVQEVASGISLQHGVLIQEFSRDDDEKDARSSLNDIISPLLTTAFEQGDIDLVKYIMGRYLRKLDGFKKNTKWDGRYAASLNRFAKLLITQNRDDLYDYLIDEYSIAWFSDKKTFKELDSRSINVLIQLLQDYILNGNDEKLILKSISILENMLLIIGNDKRRKSDLNDITDDIKTSILNVSYELVKRQKNFPVWLLQEKLSFIGCHAVKTNNQRLFYMIKPSLITIGLLTKDKELDCGAQKCSKSIYEHVLDGLMYIYSWREKVPTDQVGWFDKGFKDMAEKILGYEVTLYPDKEDWIKVNKKKPRKLTFAQVSNVSSYSQRLDLDFSALKDSDIERLVHRYSSLL